MKALLLLLLVPTVALAKPHHASEYLPAVGTRWEFDSLERKATPNETVVVASKDDDGALHVDEVDGETHMASVIWWLEAGNWMEKPAIGAERGPHRILPETFDVGTTWTDDYSRSRVAKVGDTVTLLDKKKHGGLVRVDETRNDAPELTIAHWFAPGQGEVAVKAGESWQRSLRKVSSAKKK